MTLVNMLYLNYCKHFIYTVLIFFFNKKLLQTYLTFSIAILNAPSIF